MLKRQFSIIQGLCAALFFAWTQKLPAASDGCVAALVFSVFVQIKPTKYNMLISEIGMLGQVVEVYWHLSPFVFSQSAKLS